MRKHTFPWLFVAILSTGLLTFTSTASAPTPLAAAATHYYVDAAHGSNTTGDGSQGTPWKTITWALNHISGSDIQVHVAPGTYNASLGENFPLAAQPGISLIGAGYTSTTLAGVSSQAVVFFSSTYVYTETTVLSGFTISGGSSGVYVEGIGGAGSNPTIEANRITGNTYGIYNKVDAGRRVYTVIKDNLISGNTFHGIYNHADYAQAHASPQIMRNQIISNGGAGIHCYAAASGSDTSYCSPVVTGNTIANNNGNGMTCQTYYAGACNAQLTGNNIFNNQGWGIGRSHDGSYLSTSYPKLINNLVADNASGGMFFITYYSHYDQPLIASNTVVNNHAYGIRDGAPTIVNSIVWGHTDDLNASVSAVSYSDIGDTDYMGSNYNLSADPLFINPTLGNYHLSDNSPAIDVGHNSQPDLPATDMDGDPRIVHGTVDMGADEAAPDLSASAKLAPALAAPGQAINYTIIARNDGAFNLTQTWLTDTLPPLAVYVPGSLHASAGSANFASGIITWTGALVAGAPVTLTFAVTTNSALSDSSHLTNTVVITHPLLNATHRMTATTTLYRVNLHTSQKTVAPSRLAQGQTLTYTLTISNTGIDAANARLTDTLPSELSYQADSLTADAGIANVAGQTITWQGTLAPGASARVRFRATVNLAVPDNTSVTNKATLDDGVHPPFELAAPPVLISHYRIQMPLILRRWPPVPYPPTLNPISPNPSTNGNYTVSWVPGAGPAPTSYDIEENGIVVVSNYVGTSYAFTKGAGTYTYRVRGINSYGSGPWSNSQQVVVLPSTLYSIGDACIMQGRATMNFGSATDMWVGYDDALNPDGQIVRSMIQFNVSNIPSSVAISSAVLRAYKYDSYDYAGNWRTITTFRITSPWSESAVTWNTRPSYSTAYGSAYVPHDVEGWHSFDVTSLVQGWINGSIPNYGVMLRGPEWSGSDSSWKSFLTKEEGSHTPYLSITYATQAASANGQTESEILLAETSRGYTISQTLGNSLAGNTCHNLPLSPKVKCLALPRQIPK